MDYEKIYEESKLDAPLQSVEDGLPVSESLSVEMFRKVFREADETGNTETIEEIRKRIEEKLNKYAIKMTIVPFTEENYQKYLGNGINTPVGRVKFGDNQFAKLKGKDAGGRQNLIYAVKQTLEDPIVVIHSDAPAPTEKMKNPHESLAFVKTFQYEQNEKNERGETVKTIQSFALIYYEDKEISVISNGLKRISQVLNFIKKKEDIVYEK